MMRTLPLQRTPCEKARVLLQSCEEIVKCALQDARLRAVAHGAASEEAAVRPSALGADDLLPLTVYVLIRSRAATLPAELAFIVDYLPEGYQHGSLGYALASVQCACRVALDLSWEHSLIAPLGDDAGRDALAE